MSVNCPDCGSKLEHSGGCSHCPACGWSACMVILKRLFCY